MAGFTFSGRVLLHGRCFSADSRVRYLRFAEVAETLRLFANSGLPGSDIADSDVWDHLDSRAGRAGARAIDRGMEDSIRIGNVTARQA